MELQRITTYYDPRKIEDESFFSKTLQIYSTKEVPGIFREPLFITGTPAA